MFNGKLGLVRIFDKCLTPREVFYEYMVDRFNADGEVIMNRLTHLTIIRDYNRYEVLVYTGWRQVIAWLLWRALWKLRKHRRSFANVPSKAIVYGKG